MMQLYNSAARSKELFTPRSPSEVGMYNCGPTVYDYAHIGNLRSYISADLFRRSFEFNGFTVKQVINITDVGHLTDDGDDGDDKVERRARAEKKSADEITNFFTSAFLSDLTSLNIQTEQVLFPKATDHIPEQIELIERLEKKGLTYRTSDGIYFNTAKLSSYDVFNAVGERLMKGARVEINSEKHLHTDFALWKFSPEKEKRQQEWDSPWGVGFPGWHLECSAMSMKYLGESFDVHTGGIDHKFPHHPNEIAQSESVTGKPLARYWLHTEFLSVNGRKMAKSDGTFITLQDITEKGFSPLDLRYLLLTAHYRTPVNFTWEALQGAQNASRRLKGAVLSLESKAAEVHRGYRDALGEAVNDDFDSPRVIALLWELIKDRGVKRDIKRSTVELFDSVLGLSLTEAEDEQISVPPTVQALLKKRTAARTAKDWETSDSLREEIRAHGFDVKDTDNGQTVTPAL